MLSEQLAPSAALHLSCNSVNANLKTKDDHCFFSFNNDCDSNKTKTQQQQLQDSKILMTNQVKKTTTTVATATPAATTTTTAVLCINNIIPNTAASPTTAATTTTTIKSCTAATKSSTLAPNSLSTAATKIASPTKTSSSSQCQPPIASATITPATGSLRKRNIAAPAVATQTHASKSAIATTNDASGRSAALERAYVHDVYENCEEPTGPIRPRVAQFLSNLDPGSVVCDVGCGSGRYLTQCNPLICTVGVDRCYRLSKVAREKGGEVALCDNLELPFRDESFDAVLSLAVVHHFATTERRVGALRELARILRIGGRVVITVWALEQRHRRFESQDVLIPWQPPKNRNFNYSDEEDDDDFLPPYHAYTEDSTNSSRSAGDGDSSSLSSSSPGESCYSFVRRAIQKLAGGRKHPWFLDSWTSKDTKNDSSLDYEDAKDLPIELRRLEDFEDFPDPPLSAGLKSRSLGSILNPPPRQIVRSRSSVPSLGGPLLQAEVAHKPATHQTPQCAQFLSTNNDNNAPAHNSHSPTGGSTATSSAAPASARRPKLIKQKQSLCDDDYQLPENPFHMLSSYNSSSNSACSSLYMRSGSHATTQPPHTQMSARQMAQASNFLRKQSSLNEELMAGNRIREKERVRKRIQKQMSLNEAFLCRSALFSRRLQVIREGFTTKIKTSTGSLERVTKNGISKIMHNLKSGQQTTSSDSDSTQSSATATQNITQVPPSQCTPQAQTQHHHHHHNTFHGQSALPHLMHKPLSLGGIIASKFNAATVSYCSAPDCASASAACYCSAYHTVSSTSSSCTTEDQQNKPRRHSRESGSDSSKDSSLQSDTSIESEDSFASVIFIPKPENQQQQQLNYQQQHQNSNSSSSNSSSSNGGNRGSNSQPQQRCNHFNHGTQQNPQQRLSSVPTSPLIMPCPPTPAHSPAAAQTAVTSPPQTMAAVTAAMAILTPPSKVTATVCAESTQNAESTSAKNRFNFDEAHIKQQQKQQAQQEQNKPPSSNRNQPPPPPPAAKITRQTIKDLPPIPKFRKQQSLQLQRQSFPIVRRSSATSGALPNMPKLMSLELFNPATDDLDSDSSEPSSPDSIDSVISAPKSANVSNAADEQTAAKRSDDDADDDNLEQIIKLQQQQYHNGELSINAAAHNDIILNDDSGHILRTHATTNGKPPNCAEFAEQLSAQLQRELDDKNKHGVECRSLDSIGDINDYLEDASHKKRGNGAESRDLNAFREELRERRLMLANLSTQPSLQQSPTSSSTSSLSSQTRSFTIHEEDEGDEDCEEENERSYTLQLYENCKISKFSYKRNRQYNLNPETAYLLQDDGDSSIRDDDELDEMEHDVILEEDEEEEAAAEADGGDQLGESFKEYGRKNSRNTIRCDDDTCDDTHEHVAKATTSGTQQQPLQNRQSTESWEHSNSSTTSLDSPSQGGATTHHRYYHVFREGELDALINHHVASLHIVSSYYERASWCVVAEKVQVWTI